jgi:pimeloyl-ACP methyl ester carboxylesterase
VESLVPAATQPTELGWLEMAAPLHSVRIGTGPRAVLGFHGWGGGPDSFAPLAGYVPESCSFFWPDLPGYGRSAEPTHWTLDTILDSVESFADANDLSGAVFVASCVGSPFAIGLAQRRPDLVSRIVLIDAFAYMPVYFRVFTWGVFGQVAYYSTFANPLGRLLTNASLTSKRTADADMTGSFKAIRHRTALRYLKIAAQIDSRALCEGVHVPVDIVYGRSSFQAVKHSAQLLSEFLENGRVHEVRAGHLPIHEATDEVARFAFEERG